MPLSIVQTVAPVQEPVHVEELKEYLRIDHDIEDNLLYMLLVAARSSCELYLRRQLMTATWQLRLPGWPWSNVIRPPNPPLQSVTSITYVDTAGATQTLDSSLYQVDTVSEPGRIMAAYGETWPSVRGETLNPITVTYVAGWQTPEKVPYNIRVALMMYVADLYEHREAQLDVKVEKNYTAMMLLNSYRLIGFPA